MSGCLCEDLIFEIFTRLPSKSLIRFRTLSKLLCSCIANTGFIRMNNFRSPEKVLLEHVACIKKEHDVESFYTLHIKDQLLTCPGRGYIGITTLELPYKGYCYILESYNGIICLLEPNNGIRLWNPSIRRKLVVPDCPWRYCPHCKLSGGYCSTGIGFGFDPITNDYKIVSLARVSGKEESSFLYTKKTGVWCPIASPPPSDYTDYTVTSQGCFANGALHWVVERDFTRPNGVDCRFYILTFNLSTHVFGMIALPKPIWKTIRLTTVQGSLAVISSKDGDNWVWVMREYNDTTSWSVIFKSKTNQVQGEIVKVLQLTNNGDMLFRGILGEGCQVYDTTIGVGSRLPNLNATFGIIDVEMYVESLHLFDTGTTC